MESEDEYDRSYREKHNRNKFRGERQGDGSYSKRSRDHQRSRDWQYSERSASHHYNGRLTDREDYCARRGKRQREMDDEPYEGRKKGQRSPQESPKRVKQADDSSMEEKQTGGQNFIRPGPHVNPNFFGSTVPNFPTALNRFSVPPFQSHPMQQWPAPPRPEFANRLLNFKAFLASQEDDITDEEAQKKYSSYKEGFLRVQVQEFFQEHQEEEWFRQRYHPTELAKVLLEKTEAVKERLAIFMQYQQVIGIDGLVLDSSETVKLTKFLNDIVVLLEGGNVEEILETPELKSDTKPGASDISKEDKKKSIILEKSNTTEINNFDEEVFKIFKSGEITKLYGNKDGIMELVNKAIPVNGKTAGDHCTEVSVELPRTNDEDDISFMAEMHKSSGEITGNSGSSEDEGRLDKFILEDSEKINETVVEEPKKPTPIELVSVPECKPPAIPVAKPRSNLLNLNSIFIRSLPPTFTKQEVEVICSQHDGFIRLALADPTAERNWLRRAWATYDSTVNLSSIVYRMNTHKVEPRSNNAGQPRNYSLGVMVNRKLSNRIRYGSPLATHPRSIRTDVRLAAQLAYCLDRKHHLWEDNNAEDGGQKEEQSWMMGILTSKNPLLDNAMNYLTEETSAEEDELLGNSDPSDSISESSLHSLTCFMDRLLIYLRVVHSVDFYQRCEYVNEHHMPNRCGIMHVRGVSDIVTPSAMDVDNYCKETVNVITKVFLEPPPEVSSAEQQKLGAKDKEVEMEKMVEASTKTLSETKLQCAFCSKRFRTAFFVRKHIEIKHIEKLEEVVTNVEFFNNFLRDAKRPKIWDPSSASKEKMMRREPMPLYNAMSAPRGFNGRGNFRPGGPGFGPFGPYPMPGMQRGGGGCYPNYRYQGPGAGPMDLYNRPVINYRDLDTPVADDDVFI